MYGIPLAFAVPSTGAQFFCKALACKVPVVKKGTYCGIHKCAVKDCEERAAIYSEYCYDCGRIV